MLMSCCAYGKACENIFRNMCRSLEQIEKKGIAKAQRIDKLLLHIDGAIDILQEIEEGKPSICAKTMKERIYAKDAVDLMFRVIPIIPMQAANAIVTLLMMTMRVSPNRSLPEHLIHDSEALRKLLSLFGSPSHFAVANTIVQACLLDSPGFVIHLFEIGFVESFIMFLSPSYGFDRLSSTFTTYNLMFNSHPDVVPAFVMRKRDLFCIQFKQLLTSPDYVFQLHTLELLSTFLYQNENFEFRKHFLSDPETLQLIMILLKSNSKRVQGEAYDIFRLYVYNPYRGQSVTSVLSKNSGILLSMLDSIPHASRSNFMIDQLKLMEQEEEANTKYISELPSDDIFVDSF